MPFDENRTCENCLFRLVLPDQVDRCRFNAPIPKMYNIGEDMTQHNVTRFPKCPGPACGQWEAAFEEPIIEPEPEEPGMVTKD